MAMKRHVPRADLRALRNDVAVTGVIARLGIPWKVRDGYFRFLCPRCSDFHTAASQETNLARCFRCGVSFNPIDIVMAARGVSFLDAVRYLREEAASIREP
jgi:DNA primase